MSCFLAVAKNTISYQFKKRALSTPTSAIHSRVNIRASSVHSPVKRAKLQRKKETGLDSLSYNHQKDKPHLSILGAEDDSLPITPLAIKKGPPFHILNNPVPKGFDAEKDIWLVNQESCNWEPSRDDDNVLGLLDSKPYKQYSRVFDFVNENPQLGAINTNGTADLDVRLTRKTVQEFYRYIDVHVDAEADRYGAKVLLELLQTYTTAKGSVWSNSAGRGALVEFLRAAGYVCSFHAEKMLKPCPQVWAFNEGGSSVNNKGNLHANKKVNITKKGMSILRKTSTWMVPNDQNDPNITMIPTKHWAYKRWIPDAYLAVYPGESVYPSNPNVSPIGMIVGEVKSDTNFLKLNEQQAFAQALVGLYYGPSTAALLMSPEYAQFQYIRVDNGLVHTEKKEYFQYPSFKTLFTDLVLYLWNSYFKDYK